MLFASLEQVALTIIVALASGTRFGRRFAGCCRDVAILELQIQYRSGRDARGTGTYLAIAISHHRITTRQGRMMADSRQRSGQGPQLVARPTSSWSV